MFNDALSISQCEDLVANLSKCVFPFMCAHGRPSMVPLVNLGDTAFVRNGPDGGLQSSITNDVGSEEDFVHAWKRWKQK
jgi:DNA mismatch repair protein MLH3